MDEQGTLGGIPMTGGEGSPPEDDEKRIVAYVDTKLEESRRTANRVAHEAIWLTNTAHLLGYQSFTWDSQARAFRAANNAPYFGRKQRLQTNRILPTIQNRTARLCKVEPRYDVRPNSMQVEDKEACQLGKSLIDHYWDSQKINRKRIDLTMWKQQCGHCYLKVTWDIDAGPRLPNPEPEAMPGQPEMPQMAQGPKPIVKQGDIRIDITPAFEVYPDPQAKSMEEIQYLIQTKIRPLSYFRLQYPDKGALVKEEVTYLLGLQYQQRINSMNSRNEGDGSALKQKDCAVEKAFYQAPTDKYPEGRLIITANGVLLDDKPLPCGEIPFVKFDDVVIGGKFYSEAIITHMRPVQEQLNRLINRRADWTNKLVAGKYAVARGAGIAQEALDDQSGEILEYDPVPNAPDGGRPTAIAVPMIPEYAYKEEERMLNALYEIAGISDVARGQIPSASIPARGMEILLESDSTRIGIMTEADEHSFAHLGRLILLYAQKFISEPRLLKQASNQGYLVRSFTGADLKGNTDVIVVRGSMIPNSQVIKRQDIMNIFGQGLFGDPADPAVREKVLGMLEFGDIAEAWKDQTLDEMQVKRVIEQIEQGQMPMISDFDNHPYWLKELNRYRKTEKYDQLDPMKKMIFDQVMEACVTKTMPPQFQAPPAPMSSSANQPPQAGGNMAGAQPSEPGQAMPSQEPGL